MDTWLCTELTQLPPSRTEPSATTGGVSIVAATIAANYRPVDRVKMYYLLQNIPDLNEAIHLRKPVKFYKMPASKRENLEFDLRSWKQPDIEAFVSGSRVPRLNC